LHRHAPLLIKMNLAKLGLVILIASCVEARSAFAKTASCPCNPCPCSPCTCGGSGGGSKSKPSAPQKSAPGKNTSTKTPSNKSESGKTTSKHHEGGRGKGHDGSRGGGVGVGVGVNVDLGGIGQRRAEPDPFGVGGPPIPRTQERVEKPKQKKPEREMATTNPFTDVSLTGEEAKGDMSTPSPINVSDDTESPPSGTKETAFTMDDLKKAQDAYKKARDKFLKANPDWPKLLSDFAGNDPKTSDAKKSKEAQKKIAKLYDQFKQSDEGKKLFDDWMKTYQALNTKDAQIPDDLVPPDKLEMAKHDLATTQHALDLEREIYNKGKSQAVADNPGVKNIQAEIEKLKKTPHYSDKDAQADKDKLKQLEADLEKAKKQVEKDWASSNEAKNQMKKVQLAEKELDKAKEAFKPYEGLEQNPPKAASNP